jgi:hypothetical protein
VSVDELVEGRFVGGNGSGVGSVKAGVLLFAAEDVKVSMVVLSTAI